MGLGPGGKGELMHFLPQRKSGGESFLRICSYIMEPVLAGHIQKAFTHAFLDQINTLKTLCLGGH